MVPLHLTIIANRVEPIMPFRADHRVNSTAGSIDDRAVHEAAQLPTEVERDGRHQLGHEDHPHVFDRVDPERRRCGATQ